MVQWITFRKWYGIVFVVLLSHVQLMIAADDRATQDSVPALVHVDEEQIVSPNIHASSQGKSFENFLDQISGSTDKRPVNDFDLEDLQQELLKILASHYKSLFEKRNSMFALLAQDDQEKMKEAEKSYQDVVEKIDITNIVTTLCTSVRDADSQGSFAFFDEEKHQTFVDLLEKLRIALNNRTFIHLFKGLDENADGDVGMMVSPDQIFNMAGQLGKQDSFSASELALSSDELGLLINCLDEILTNLGIGQSTQTIQGLHAFLSAVHKKQSNQVTSLVLAWIKDDVNRTLELLKEVVAQFEAVQVKGLDQNVKEAYEFWLKTLKRFYRSLWVFDSLRADASLDATRLSHHLFTFVTHGYDIAKGFFDLYKLDNDVKKFSGPVAADWVLCSSLATWHFFNMKSDFSNGLLLQTILGDMKVDSFEARQLLMFNAMVIPWVIPVLFDPSFWNKKPYGLAKAVHKVITAWVYYLVVDGDLFGENASWWSAQGPNDRHIRKALWFALNEGTSYLSRVIQQKIVYNTNPMVLENARNYSMGIIRPAMVGYLVKAIVPLVFLRNNPLGTPEIPGLSNIVEFNREDIYGKDFMKSLFGKCQYQYLREQALNRNLQPNQPRGDVFGAAGDQALANSLAATYRNNREYQDDYDRYRNSKINLNTSRTADQIAQDYQQVYQINVDKYYLASLATSYVGDSVGGFWGRKLAQSYKSQLYTAAEKVLGVLGFGLETIGLMSHEQIESIKEIKQDFVSEFEHELILLKFILKTVFEVNSSFRNVIIPLLVNRGYLEEGETNPIEINRVIVYFAVDFLAQWKLLNYSDAARIAHQFDLDPQATEKAIDGIIDGVFGGLVGTAGEYVGSVAGRGGAWYLFRNHSPYAT